MRGIICPQMILNECWNFIEGAIYVVFKIFSMINFFFFGLNSRNFFSHRLANLIVGDFSSWLACGCLLAVSSRDGACLIFKYTYFLLSIFMFTEKSCRKYQQLLCVLPLSAHPKFPLSSLPFPDVIQLELYGMYPFQTGFCNLVLCI